QDGADGYAPDAEISELGDRQLTIETRNEDIDRFWRHRFHDLFNLLRLLDAGSVKTIGASLTVRGKPVESDSKWIGASDQPGFTSPGQHHWDCGSINGTTRRTDAIDSPFFFVERFCVASRVVLNRQAGDALRDAKLCIFGHRFGLIGDSVRQLIVDWQCCGVSNFTDVTQHFGEGDSVIGFAAGKSETG